MTAGKKSRRYKATPERELNVPALRVFKPVNYSYHAAVDYQNYYLLKSSSHYDNDMAHELYKMAKEIAVQIRDHTFPRKDLVPVIILQQDPKSACDAYGIRDCSVMCVFK